MKTLWKLLNEKEMKSKNKACLFLLFLMLGCLILGAAAWAVAGRFFLPGTLWLLAFMCYPAVFIGCFGGILFLYNHNFS